MDLTKFLPALPRPSRQVLKILVVALAYYLAAKLSLRFALIEENVTLIWPPTGLAVAALLLWGRPVWPGIAAGAYFVNAPISPSFVVAAAIAVGNTLAPLVAVWLLERFDFRKDMQRLQDALAIVAAALVGMLVSATIGSGALALGGVLGSTSFGSAWSVWWAGDAMGVLIASPCLLILRHAPRRSDGHRPRPTEAAIALLGLAVASWVALVTDFHLLYLPFPFIMWLSWRFRQRAAVAAVVVVSGTALWAASSGTGSFLGHDLLQKMVTLQAFNASVALTAFVLAALSTERMEAQQILMRAGAVLELQVQERTAELHGAIEKLAEAQQLAQLGSWTWDVATDTVKWTDELYRIYGLTADHHTPSYQGLLKQIHPDERKSFEETIQRSLASGEPFSSIRRIVRPDGTIRWVQSTGQALRDERGNTVRMVGTCQDITERKRTQDARVASEERLRLVLETANDAFVAMDSGGLITEWNKQAEAVFGWSREEILGQSLASTIIPPEWRDAHMSGLSRYFQAGESTILNRLIEVTALHRDGREFPVELTVWPITTDGQTHFNAFIKDVTARKRAEGELATRTAELRRSNAELGRFAYVASHDLQEPMRMVASYVQLIERRYGDRLDSDGREFIGYAVEGATRMQSLIQSLLAYARVDSQGVKLVPIRLEEIVDEVLTNLEGFVSDAAAQVVAGPLPTIQADRQQMVQLFQNLVSNAIKFRSEVAPRVEIHAALSRGEWLLSITDNGIGIDPVFSERIFGVFQRLHTRDDYPGSGIGLSLCRRIVEHHGGRIWVEPRPEGGSTFYFTLPVRDRMLVDA